MCVCVCVCVCVQLFVLASLFSFLSLRLCLRLCLCLPPFIAGHTHSARVDLRSHAIMTAYAPSGFASMGPSAMLGGEGYDAKCLGAILINLACLTFSEISTFLLELQ